MQSVIITNCLQVSALSRMARYPNFFLKNSWLRYSSSPAIANLQKGLAKLGIYQVPHADLHVYSTNLLFDVTSKSQQGERHIRKLLDNVKTVRTLIKH